MAAKTGAVSASAVLGARFLFVCLFASSATASDSSSPGAVAVTDHSPLKFVQGNIGLIRSRERRSSSASHGRETSSNSGGQDACASEVSHFPASCISLLNDLDFSLLSSPANPSSASKSTFESLCASRACLHSISAVAEKCSGHHNASSELAGSHHNYTIAELLEVSCAKNEHGQSCFEAFYTLNPGGDDVSCAIPDDLSSTTGHECSQACAQRISSLANNTGCCINTFYKTFTTNELLKNALLNIWSTCHVTDPGQCKVTASSSLSQFMLSSYLCAVFVLLASLPTLL